MNTNIKVDSKFDDMEPGGRKAARDAELRPLMEDFGGMGAGQLPLASPKLVYFVKSVFRV